MSQVLDIYDIKQFILSLFNNSSYELNAFRFSLRFQKHEETIALTWFSEESQKGPIIKEGMQINIDELILELTEYLIQQNLNVHLFSLSTYAPKSHFEELKINATRFDEYSLSYERFNNGITGSLQFLLKDD